MFLITNLYRVSLLFSPFSRMKIDYLSPVCCKISEWSVGTDMPGMHIVAPSLLHSMLTYIYIYIYICTASKETIESDPRDIPPHSLDSISNVLFVRSWCIAWPSLLTPSLEECSTSDWRLARHGSCPRRAPCPTSSRIIIVEAEESSIASWNYFWQGKWWKKKMEETETSISFVLRSTVRLLQKLTSVSPYHSVLFYLKIRGFSTKFNQFRFLCFLYIYIVLDSLENALERYWNRQQRFERIYN